MSLFIDDGATLEGTIDAHPGLYPAIKATYRPALPAETERYLAALREQSTAAKDPVKHKIDLLTKHLVSWDAADAQGQPVPLSAAVLRRTRHQALAALVDLVLGYALSGEAETDAGN